MFVRSVQSKTAFSHVHLNVWLITPFQLSKDFHLWANQSCIHIALGIQWGSANQVWELNICCSSFDSILPRLLHTLPRMQPTRDRCKRAQDCLELDRLWDVASAGEELFCARGCHSYLCQRERQIMPAYLVIIFMAPCLGLILIRDTLLSKMLLAHLTLHYHCWICTEVCLCRNNNWVMLNCFEDTGYRLLTYIFAYLAVHTSSV